MRVLKTSASLVATILIVTWCFIDPYDRHSIVAGSVVLASSVVIFFGIAAFVRSALLASVAAMSFAFVLTFGWRVSAPSHARLEDLAEPTIRALNGFHEERGRYPASLDEIGVQLPSTRFGEYQYRSEHEGQDFTLRIGDYGEDLFTGYYTSSDARWYWDT